MNNIIPNNGTDTPSQVKEPGKSFKDFIEFRTKMWKGNRIYVQLLQNESMVCLRYQFRSEGIPEKQVAL